MTQEQLVYYAKKLQEEWSLEQLIEKVFLNNNEVGSTTTQPDENMSDTRYPTRMHEVLGVETGERFNIEKLPDEFFLNHEGRMTVVTAGRMFNSSGDILTYAINNGIIHLPPSLTDEQREQLKAIWTLGGRWIAKDKIGDVFAYDSKPQKILLRNRWNNDADGGYFTVMRELIVCATVSWSDPEPFDIGKALGVEI